LLRGSDTSMCFKLCWAALLMRISVSITDLFYHIRRGQTYLLLQKVGLTPSS